MERSEIQRDQALRYIFDDATAGHYPEFDPYWGKTDKKVADAIARWPVAASNPYLLRCFHETYDMHPENFRKSIVEPSMRDKSISPLPEKLVKDILYHFTRLYLPHEESLSDFKERVLYNAPEKVYALGFNIPLQSPEGLWYRVPRVIIPSITESKKRSITILYLSHIDPADEMLNLKMENILFYTSRQIPSQERSLAAFARALRASDFTDGFPAFAYVDGLKGLELVEAKSEVGYGLTKADNRLIITHHFGGEVASRLPSTLRADGYHRTEQGTTTIIPHFREQHVLFSPTVERLAEAKNEAIAIFADDPDIIPDLAQTMLSVTPHFTPDMLDLNNPDRFDYSWWQKLANTLSRLSEKTPDEWKDALHQEISPDFYHIDQILALGIAYAASLKQLYESKLAPTLYAKGIQYPVFREHMIAMIGHIFSRDPYRAVDASLIHMGLTNPDMYGICSNGRESLAKAIDFNSKQQLLLSHLPIAFEHTPQATHPIFSPSFWKEITESLFIPSHRASQQESSLQHALQEHMQKLYTSLDRATIVQEKAATTGKLLHTEYFSLTRHYAEMIKHALLFSFIHQGDTRALYTLLQEVATFSAPESARYPTLDLTRFLQPEKRDPKLESERTIVLEKLRARMDVEEFVRVFANHVPENWLIDFDLENPYLFDNEFWFTLRVNFPRVHSDTVIHRLAGARGIIEKDWNITSMQTAVRYLLFAAYQVHMIADSLDSPLLPVLLYDELLAPTLGDEKKAYEARTTVAHFLLRNQNLTAPDIYFSSRAEFDEYYDVDTVLTQVAHTLQLSPELLIQAKYLLLGQEFYTRALEGIDMRRHRNIPVFGSKKETQLIRNIAESKSLFQRTHDMRQILPRLEKILGNAARVKVATGQDTITYRAKEDLSWVNEALKQAISS